MSARIRPAIAVVAALASSLAFTTPALASGGELDPSFGDGGIVTTPIGATGGAANGMAIERVLTDNGSAYRSAVHARSPAGRSASSTCAPARGGRRPTATPSVSSARC
jgi:hypothetical protein